MNSLIYFLPQIFDFFFYYFIDKEIEFEEVKYLAQGHIY